MEPTPICQRCHVFIDSLAHLWRARCAESLSEVSFRYHHYKRRPERMFGDEPVSATRAPAPCPAAALALTRILYEGSFPSVVQQMGNHFINWKNNDNRPTIWGTHVTTFNAIGVHLTTLVIARRNPHTRAKSRHEMDIFSRRRPQTHAIHAAHHQNASS